MFLWFFHLQILDKATFSFSFIFSVYIFFFSLYKNIYVTYVTSSSTITCLLDGWKRGEAIIERWRQSGAWSMRSDICVSTAQCGVSDGTEKETKRNERKHRVNVISLRKTNPPLPPLFLFSLFRTCSTTIIQLLC
jgi:hypothetical protein